MMSASAPSLVFWVSLGAVAFTLGASAGCRKGAPDSRDASEPDDAALAVDAASPSALGDHAPGGPADAGDPEAWPPSSADLTPRVRHLVEAIGQNSPDLASDILLPREAYTAARDASDPTKAWERTVLLPFRKAVAAQHKKLRGGERARFVSFELGTQVATVTPKRKEWKQPLWRVRHSKLTFTIDGKPHRIDIAEMIGFRGSWYVSKLR